IRHQFERVFLSICQGNFHGHNFDLIGTKNQASSITIGIEDKLTNSLVFLLITPLTVKRVPS
ncbi:hypothetical protein, partial [Xenorhabdus nematophila]|uniref:hypothetical protein n=1 Tax=Xenorhabdus nematophila TaxID=628 RepID=UPI001E409EB0